ncbi:MAG: molybdopterin-binding oxidoreductase [Proteobacteria bacterium]|nr:MAG: molybdopterin-binding oxidoreductase [Pseudomonadota bacterium]
MNSRKLKLRTLFSFLVLGICGAVGYGLYSRAWMAPEVEGLPAPFRAGLEANAGFWKKFTGERKSAPRREPKPGEKFRVNGDLGLSGPVDEKTWRLEVIANDADPSAKPLSLSMEDIRKLPRSESSAEFRCIEGWSEPIAYAGVRFSDFVRILGLGGRGGQAPDFNGAKLKDLYPYVALETPDGEYYVSLDMESMLHSQTILAYELNGKPLSADNGAPLRLVVPVKYGIKSLKRIGKIYFSEKRPRDYWEESGYDWFAGL